MSFSPIDEILQDLKKGEFVVLIDDEKRENEGDLILASDFISPEAVNFMTQEARGLVCASITIDQAEKLSLNLMVDERKNFSPHKTAFTVSVEAAKGVSTGISAKDRAKTIKALCHPKAKPGDVISPGHIFPIRAKKGGVLKRAGHTEASVDLCRLAGLNPSAVICEIVNRDGTMARLPDLEKFCKKHKIKMASIESLIKYRLEKDSLVEQRESMEFETSLGKDWRIHIFYDSVNEREHLVLVKGDIKKEDSVLVRVQRSSLTGDLFGNKKIRSEKGLRQSLKRINEEGAGVFVYLMMQNSLSSNLKELKKKEGLSRDEKDYGIGAQILKALGLTRIRPLVSDPSSRKPALKGYGLLFDKNEPLFKEKKP